MADITPAGPAASKGLSGGAMLVIGLLVGGIIGFMSSPDTSTTTTTEQDAALLAENERLQDELTELRSELSGAEAPAEEAPEPEPAAGGGTVLTASGTNSTETRTFTVDGAWEIAWEVEQSSVMPSFAAYDESGLPVEMWDTQDAPKSKALVNQGGTFYIEVSTYVPGQWKVRVTDVP